MESQQHANPGGGGDDTDHVANDEPGLPLENYEFTFDLAQLPGSGNMSFIEPEPWTMSDTASLSDSVQTFPEEFGRTYHAYRAGCKMPLFAVSWPRN